MTESDVGALFHQIRWSETDGKPVCPQCNHPESLWMANQHRWICKGCCRQFSVTSSTILAYKRMDIREVFRAARMFVMMPKGQSTITISHELGCDYRSARVLEHKFPEAMLNPPDRTRMALRAERTRISEILLALLRRRYEN
ncbi:transposase [Qipengyuania spongiae]|uniref:Transposase n=1 Tax=Qipengyuania spongiae TaxID=2909673 RepID=A0ABY5SZ82_9SPHN|nr:transposase [Qipengyuania spongiae]UVI38386.1 transposase [Qipengyuania spongiae]